MHTYVGICLYVCLGYSLEFSSLVSDFSTEIGGHVVVLSNMCAVELRLCLSVCFESRPRHATVDNKGRD